MLLGFVKFELLINNMVDDDDGNDDYEHSVPTGSSHIACHPRRFLN